MRIYAKISDAVQNKRTNTFETSGIKEKESNNTKPCDFATFNQFSYCTFNGRNTENRKLFVH
jgi:hypothetical protein